MSSNQSRRVNLAVLKEDQDALTALATITDYKPANAAYTLVNLTAALTAMQAAQQAVVRAQGTLDTARDAAAAAEWRFHEAVLGAKDQVLAQYGKSSDQLQLLGLKKKSERKRPVRAAKAG